ncbi:MAG TPA: hypothetical protein ENI81_00740, partial [Phycisphaerales bacterium]|nr:hypothetical protein [Phycisphaerales bacterium]
ALLEEKVDLAVHSFKDLSSKSPAGLEVAAVTEREDPRDLLIIHPKAYAPDAAPPFYSPSGGRGDEESSVIPLKRGVSVGTSSVRRSAQLKNMRPDIRIKDLRGNVPTRLQKLADEQYDAIILAAAGLNRLGINPSQFNITKCNITRFVPAPGQGALAVQMRDQDPLFGKVRKLLHHEITGRATSLERKVMLRFGGGCGLPLGVLAKSVDDFWELFGFWGGDPGQPVWAHVKGSYDDDLPEILYNKLQVANHRQ